MSSKETQAEPGQSDLHAPRLLALEAREAVLKARIAELEAQVCEACAALAVADKMISEHIEKFHDFDYEPHQVPPELSDLRMIEHHLMGSLILDEDIAALTPDRKANEGK